MHQHLLDRRPALAAVLDGVAAAGQPELAAAPADPGVVLGRQPAAAQLGVQLQRDQLVVHERGGPAAELLLGGRQGEVHAGSFSSMSCCRRRELALVLRAKAGDAGSQQVLLAQHQRQPAGGPGVQAPGPVEQPPALAQEREPGVGVAAAHELGDAGLGRPGLAAEPADQRGRLAFDLGRQEEPGVAAHASSIPGTASRSWSWKCSTAASLRFSTPRS